MRPLDSYRYWVFDLDGTITKPIHDFAEIRRQLAIPADQDILAYIAGQPEHERVRLDAELSVIEEALARKSQANPGAKVFLQQLAEAGVTLGILTRNQRHCVDITLEAIGCDGFFPPEVIVASGNAPPKPDPAGIHHLLTLWQADIEQTLIVGDFRFDLEAGRAAGIATVHFAPEGEALWPELTDLRVSSFQQLTALFRAGA